MAIGSSQTPCMSRDTPIFSPARRVSSTPPRSQATSRPNSPRSPSPPKERDPPKKPAATRAIPAASAATTTATNPTSHQGSFQTGHARTPACPAALRPGRPGGPWPAEVMRPPQRDPYSLEGRQRNAHMMSRIVMMGDAQCQVIVTQRYINRFGSTLSDDYVTCRDQGRITHNGRRKKNYRRVLLAATTTAATVPTAPHATTTVSGATWPAAAPASTMTTPCPKLMPPWARPNAWLRWSGGAAVTKAAFAASWKQASTPDRARMASAAGSQGRGANSTSTAQVAIASGAVQRSRRSGLTTRLNATEPTMAPNAPAARTRPSATDPPSSERASGAAIPSGAL